MKCQDCIHYAVCRNPFRYSLEHFVSQHCDHFKDKSRMVELPCNVGDIVYTLYSRQHWNKDTNNWVIDGWEIHENKVSMLQQKADKSWKIRISPKRTGVYDVTLDEIGKSVFLTKSEAENALAERSKNGNAGI